MKKQWKNILVVDDSRFTRAVFSDELEALGYNVFTAADVEEADRILHGESIDIAFVDIVLPNMSGLEYLERPQFVNKDVLMIVMTGHESVSTAVEAISKGAYDYLIKPVEPSSLELIIKKAIKHYEIDKGIKDALVNDERTLRIIKNRLEEAESSVHALKAEVNEILASAGKEPKYNLKE